MADDDTKVPVRKIPMGVSGLGPKRSKPEPSAKIDPNFKGVGGGTYQVPAVWPEYNKGGIVGPNVTKWGSPKVSAPCKDTKTLKCY